MTSPDAARNKFYEDLHALLPTVPKTEKLIVLAQWLANRPVDTATADENASVENRWCQLRDTFQSTALTVLVHARRQHQDGFDDNEAVISNLLAETNRLQRAYVTRPTDDNKLAFHRSRRFVKRRLQEMEDAWTGSKAEEIRGFLFSAMLMDAYRVSVAYWTDGQLLNCWRMHFQTRVSTTTVHELLFADDCVLNTTSEGGMQISMDFFVVLSGKFGLVMNTGNKLVMHQPPTDAVYNAPYINVNGSQLQGVDTFTYLGTTLSRRRRGDLITYTSAVFDGY
ncbi:hypothetical protein SprV_0100293200 [Sparganum proliferum]